MLLRGLIDSQSKDEGGRECGSTTFEVPAELSASHTGLLLPPPPSFPHLGDNPNPTPSGGTAPTASRQAGTITAS